MTWRGRIATGWLVLALGAAGVLAGTPGVSAQEARALETGRQLAGLLTRVAGEPGRSLRALGDLSLEARRPLLAEPFHGFLSEGGERLGLGPLRGGRLGAVLVVALLAAVLALAAFDLAGVPAALLAPALLLFSPRVLAQGLQAIPDPLGALLWLLSLGALAATLDGPTRLARLRAGAGTCLLAGAAVAAMPGLWTFLGPGSAAEAPSPHLLLLGVAALPTPLMAVYLLGLAHAGARLARAFPAKDARAVRTEAMVLLAATLPLLLAAASPAPHGPGLAPVLPALPLLALLGARALAAVADRAWPKRRHALTAALGVVLLYPGLRASARTFPHGASAWGEAVGGAPGAASLGWPRQDGGEAARAILPALDAHAVPGARVLWLGVAPEAVDRYRRAGLVRADLIDAADAARADLAVVARSGGSRDAEYAAWSALGSSRAEAGVYLDEVALVQLFARPGAWR